MLLEHELSFCFMSGKRRLGIVSARSATTRQSTSVTSCGFHISAIFRGDYRPFKGLYNLGSYPELFTGSILAKLCACSYLNFLFEKKYGKKYQSQYALVKREAPTSLFLQAMVLGL